MTVNGANDVAENAAADDVEWSPAGSEDADEIGAENIAGSWGAVGNLAQGADDSDGAGKGAENAAGGGMVDDEGAGNDDAAAGNDDAPAGSNDAANGSRDAAAGSSDAAAGIRDDVGSNDGVSLCVANVL